MPNIFPLPAHTFPASPRQSQLVLFFLPSLNMCADMPLDPVGMIQRHLKGKKQHLGSMVCSEVSGAHICAQT